MSDQRALLPFYLVVDVSPSMDQARLRLADAMLPEVAEALEEHPVLRGHTRFGVLTFSDDAQVLLPLCDLLTLDFLPGLAAGGGGTEFGPALRLLGVQLRHDVAQIHADGFDVYRPVVFFVSDGQPGDDWEDEFDTLTQYDPATGDGFAAYPVVVPFGVGDVIDPDALRPLAFPRHLSRLFVLTAGGDARDAVAALGDVFTASVLLRSGPPAARARGGEDDWI